jgi:hypothetical protein
LITFPLNAFILQMHIVVLLASSSRIWRESGCLLNPFMFIYLFVYYNIDIHHLNAYRPRAILDIIKSGENFRISTTTKMPEQGTCERCGYISSQVFSSILRHFWFIWAQWICILMGLSFSWMSCTVFFSIDFTLGSYELQQL